MALCVKLESLEPLGTLLVLVFDLLPQYKSSCDPKEKLKLPWMKAFRSAALHRQVHDVSHI